MNWESHLAAALFCTLFLLCIQSWTLRLDADSNTWRTKQTARRDIRGLPRSTVTHHVNWIYSGTRYESNSSMEIAAMSLTTRMTRCPMFPLGITLHGNLNLGLGFLACPLQGLITNTPVCYQPLQGAPPAPNRYWKVPSHTSCFHYEISRITSCSPYVPARYLTVRSRHRERPASRVERLGARYLATATLYVHLVIPI